MSFFTLQRYNFLFFPQNKPLKNFCVLSIGFALLPYGELKVISLQGITQVNLVSALAASVNFVNLSICQFVIFVVVWGMINRGSTVNK